MLLYLAPLAPWLVALAPPDGWVQTSLGYSSANITHECGTSVATTSSSVTVSASSGIDDSTDAHAYPQKKTGDDPTSGPPWDSRFTPVVGTTWINQTWIFPGQTVPAYTRAVAVTDWTHAVGWQAFDKIVGGATVSSARRDLDWWTGEGHRVVYTSNGGPPGN